MFVGFGEGVELFYSDFFALAVFELLGAHDMMVEILGLVVVGFGVSTWMRGVHLNTIKSFAFAIAG